MPQNFGNKTGNPVSQAGYELIDTLVSHCGLLWTLLHNSFSNSDKLEGPVIWG